MLLLYVYWIMPFLLSFLFVKKGLSIIWQVLTISLYKSSDIPSYGYAYWEPVGILIACHSSWLKIPLRWQFHCNQQWNLLVVILLELVESTRCPWDTLWYKQYIVHFSNLTKCIYQISGHNFLVPSLRRSQNFLWPVELTEISVPNIFKYMHIFEVGHKIFEVRSQYYNTAIK